MNQMEKHNLKYYIFLKAIRVNKKLLYFINVSFI